MTTFCPICHRHTEVDEDGYATHVHSGSPYSDFPTFHSIHDEPQETDR